MIFDVDFASEILPSLLAAAVVTVEVTVVSFALALVGGLLLAMVRLSRRSFAARVAWWYIQAVRNTPFLIQLFLLFFVLPQYGLRFDALTTGIIGLGLHFSAFTAEVYRAGIEAVSRGQWEAAYALNLSMPRTWIRIILPQAIPPMIPALGNYLVGMLKDSTLLATISVTELLGTALLDASLHFRYTEPLLMVGGIFLVLSLVGSVMVRAAEARWSGRLA